MSRKRTIVEEFDPRRVKPMPGQPRKRFFGIRELADSIAEVGQLTPGIVILIDGDKDFDAQLVDGERRVRACVMAGKPFRAEVVAAADLDEMFARSVGSNFNKQHHDVVEIAEALDRMRAAGKTLEQMARIAGKTGGWCSHHLSLLKLHPQVQGMMVRQSEDDERPPLTLSLAQLLVPLDEAHQLRIARKIVADGGMGLSAARRMILKERYKSGDKLAYGAKRASGAKARSALGSTIDNTVQKLGVFTDMPGGTFNQIVDAMQPFERRKLVENMDKLIFSLEGIRDGIEERSKKARAAS